MGWNPAVVWLAVALLLGLAELFSGGLFLLALAVAAVLTAALTLLGLTLPWQLLAMGILSGILVPLTIWKIRPWFSPGKNQYGTTGTGAHRGQRFTTTQRDFDNATVILVNGDLYRICVAQSGETVLPPGTTVVFDHFDGTTAIVRLDIDH
ncbi:MAG TPA: NfeD family protein [Candidatus Halomonas stercoripullorum]|uniref:NfeD family protein n=1 Tax=Candidatus Halomonas stercoripullorum TaxID=2838617 RepID=A0A9D2B602_9GAMM|nr:NfeD family protein [Candidatus Halomonas stercoripullorum]